MYKRVTVRSKLYSFEEVREVLTACEIDDTVDAMRARVDLISDPSDVRCSDEAGALASRNETVTQLPASSIAAISSLRHTQAGRERTSSS